MPYSQHWSLVALAAALCFGRAQAHELDFGLGVVPQQIRRLGFGGVDDLDELALAGAELVRFLECFGFQCAGAGESGSRLTGHHVGVAAHGDDAGIGGASGQADDGERCGEFHHFRVHSCWA